MKPRREILVATAFVAACFVSAAHADPATKAVKMTFGGGAGTDVQAKPLALAHDGHLVAEVVIVEAIESCR